MDRLLGVERECFLVNCWKFFSLFLARAGGLWHVTQFDALGSAAFVLDTGAPGLEPYTVPTSIHILKETVESR